MESNLNRRKKKDALDCVNNFITRLNKKKVTCSKN